MHAYTNGCLTLLTVLLLEESLKLLSLETKPFAMKNLQLPFLVILTFLTTALFAQTSSGGPDTFGYTYRNSTAPNGPSYNWFDISTIGTTITGLSDDNFVGPYTISGFPYYTNTPTSLYIGSNGYIAFSPVNISSSGGQFPAIPTFGGPNNFIAPMLTDLTFGGAATNPAACYFYNSGDTIAVTWEGVPFWINNTAQYGGDNSFQVILNKKDSSITFNYKKQFGSPDPAYTTNAVSIGIENSTGNDGLQYYRGTTFPTANTSVKYYFPTTVAPLTDLGVNWVDNPENGGVFKMQNQSYTPTVNVKNLGNQNIPSSFKVGYRLISGSGAIVDSSSVQISSLQAGSDSSIQFSPIVLNQSDRYELKGYVSRVALDNLLANDSLSIRLEALDTMQTTQILDYTDGTGSILSLGWSGGNGGIAVYIEPPYYPARVLNTNFYITTLGSPPSGFHSVLYDDSGRQGSHGVVLDSALITAGQITTGSYYSHPTFTSNIVVSSGGVYLLWLMDGPGINLGRVIQTPSSSQTFEVLFGAWAPYRDAGTQDFSMGIEVAPVSTALKEGISSLEDFKVYPNPAVEYVNIELSEGVVGDDYQLMDLSGRNVEAKFMKNGDQLKLYRGNLEAGIYIVRVGKSIAKVQFSD